MRGSFWGLILLLLWAAPALAKVKVVATVTDLGAIAQAVGGGEIQVEVLARSAQDPHFVDARPNLVVALSRADLLLLNGLELEAGWLPPLLTTSRNGAIQPGGAGYLDCSTLITPQEVPLQKVDRSMGDIHPGGNPHYSKDPRNALLLAEGIARRLAELDPPHAALFQAGAQKLKETLGQKIAAWEQALAPYRGTDIVTYHKSWIYFTGWAGLNAVVFVEPKPGIPPNPAHVAKLLGVIRERKLPIILQEAWYPASTSELLAKNSGVTVVRVSGMTPEGKSYTEGMDAMVDAVVKALASHKP